MSKFFQKLEKRFPQGRRKKKRARTFAVRKNDPLFVIFERHLYDFNYESRDLFIKGVVEEYLAHLSKQKVVVPPAWRLHLETSISEEVSDMLVRRLYGCLSVEELKQKEKGSGALPTARREARKRYNKLVG